MACALKAERGWSEKNCEVRLRTNTQVETMEDLKASERRKYSRIATDQVISFAPIESSDLRGVGRNLSQGGIRFETIGCEIDYGVVLRVTFNVGPHTVEAVGKLV